MTPYKPAFGDLLTIATIAYFGLPIINWAFIKLGKTEKFTIFDWYSKGSLIYNRIYKEFF